MKKTEFTLAKFVDQMSQVRELGPLGKLIGVIPGMAEMTRQVGGVEQQITRMVAVYHSMTAKERKHPDLINSQRRRRIAHGAGVRVQEVSQFMRQFETTRCMTQQIGSLGVVPRLRRVLGLVTDDRQRRDPSWVEPEPRGESWRRLLGWIWLVVACAVALVAWCYFHRRFHRASTCR